MPDKENESTGFDNKHSNLQSYDADGEPAKTGLGIANDVEEPRAPITDDSRNTVAEQDHHGRDNSPSGGRARDAV